VKYPFRLNHDFVPLGDEGMRKNEAIPISTAASVMLVGYRHTGEQPLNQEQPAPTGVASDTSHFEQADSEEAAKYIDWTP
jgi:hypothetical protein